VFNTSQVISAATSQKIKVREFLLLQFLSRETNSVVTIVTSSPFRPLATSTSF
jgi:hypothetical protein